MKPIFCLLFSLMTMTAIYSQVGIGMTVSHDFYQRYSNDDDIKYGSAGSALLNLAVGPKIWVGGDKVSLSLEAQANLGMLGLAVKDYKGLGMVSFPLIGRLNFQGLSALDKEGKFGFSVGGGVQFNRTELYYLSGDFKDIGGTRSLFRTYVIDVAYGFGMSGFAGYAFIRYGFDPDSSAKSFNFGMQYDLNFPKLRSITDPASEL